MVRNHMVRQHSQNVGAVDGVEGPRVSRDWAREVPAASLGKSLKRGGSTDVDTDPLQGSANPLPWRGTAEGRGVKVPFGPGFYIPPPGYHTSSFGFPTGLHVPTDKTWGGKTRCSKATMPSIANQDSTHVAKNRTHFAYAQTSRPHHPMSSDRDRDQAHARCRNVGSSCKGATDAIRSIDSGLVWAILATLLSASQTLLLSFYQARHSTCCVAISLASLFLVLYAALISLISLLVGRLPRPIVDLSEPLASVGETKWNARKTRKQASTSLATSVLESIPSACGFMVCLGASTELVSLLVFAVQSSDSASRYSVLVALILALCTTLFCIGRGLLGTGHVSFGLPCSQWRRRDTRSRETPDLPISASDPPSRSSSISSHSGKYKPDYGLDSDSDSDEYKPAFRRPRADWTDKALNGVIRSPLLDMPSAHA